MEGYIDQEFLRFANYIPDKYLATMKALEEARTEVRILKDKLSGAYTLNAYYQVKISKQAEEIESLRRMTTMTFGNGHGGGNSSTASPPLASSSRALVLASTPPTSAAFGRHPQQHFQQYGGGGGGGGYHHYQFGGDESGSVFKKPARPPTVLVARDRPPYHHRPLQTFGSFRPSRPSSTVTMERALTYYGGDYGGNDHPSPNTNRSSARVLMPPAPQPLPLTIAQIKREPGTESPPTPEKRSRLSSTSTAAVQGYQEEDNLARAHSQVPEFNLALVKEEPVEETMEEDIEDYDVHTQFVDEYVPQEVNKPSIPPHPSEMILTGNFGPEDASNGYPDVASLSHPTSTVFTSSQREDLHRILEKFQTSGYYTTSEGPVPNHHLVVLVIDQEENSSTSNPSKQRDRLTFYQALGKFLEQFGGQVRYLTLCSEMDSTPTLWYQRVREYLRLMPNLRMIQLKILPSTVASSTGATWNGTSIWSQEELNDLQETCDNIHPFPGLSELETVDFENVPYQILESCLRINGGNLDKLQVIRTVSMENWTRLGGIRMEGLEEFSMTCFGMDEVRQLEAVNWPRLRKLTVKLEFEMDLFRGEDNGVDGEGGDFWRFCKILEGFGETLTDLKMTLFDRPEGNARLVLPKLERLEVYFLEEGSLNMIAGGGVGRLEELRVHLGKDVGGRDRGEDLVQLNGYVERMRRSNLWEVVPGLRRVEVTTHFGGGTKQYFDENPNLFFQ